jgi:hypothetical protein
VQALSLVVSTGNDDLRGGSNAQDDCDATVTLNSGATIYVPNINGWQTWPGWSINTVSIPVPAGLQGGDIKSVSLHTGFGGGIDGDNWNVERVQLLATLLPPPPVVGRLVPDSGLPSGGQTITINGEGFDTTGQTQFFFDGVPATNVVCTSRTQCTVTDPPGSGFAGVTANGQGGSSAGSSEFDYVPSVTGMSATTGSPGDTITVYGIGLFPGTTLTFGPYPVQSATCTIANGCSVLVPEGAGQVDIRAFVDGVETNAVAADQFTYVTPNVADIDITSGPVSGYTTFNLDGSGFPGRPVGVELDGPDDLLRRRAGPRRLLPVQQLVHGVDSARQPARARAGAGVSGRRDEHRVRDVRLLPQREHPELLGQPDRGRCPFRAAHPCRRGRAHGELQRSERLSDHTSPARRGGDERRRLVPRLDPKRDPHVHRQLRRLLRQRHARRGGASSSPSASASRRRRDVLPLRDDLLRKQREVRPALDQGLYVYRQLIGITRRTGPRKYGGPVRRLFAQCLNAPAARAGSPSSRRSRCVRWRRGCGSRTA